MAAISPDCGPHHYRGMVRHSDERRVRGRVTRKGDECAGGGGRSIWIVHAIHDFRERPYSLFRLS